MFTLILRQSIVHAFRKGGGAFGTMAFYIIVVTLFTFGLGPEIMARYAGAVMCAAMLLSSIVAMPLMYERDFEDGTLEQYLLQPITLELVALAKICGQWLSIIVPILLVSPVMVILSGLDANAAWQALLLLVIASPTMVAISSIAAALTLGTRRGGLLQALVAMPLYIPLLIFAASSGGQGAVLLLAGMVCAALPLSCVITAALIRISQD